MDHKYNINITSFPFFFSFSSYESNHKNRPAGTSDLSSLRFLIASPLMCTVTWVRAFNRWNFSETGLGRERQTEREREREREGLRIGPHRTHLLCFNHPPIVLHVPLLVTSRRATVWRHSGWGGRVVFSTGRAEPLSAQWQRNKKKRRRRRRRGGGRRSPGTQTHRKFFFFVGRGSLRRGFLLHWTSSWSMGSSCT